MNDTTGLATMTVRIRHPMMERQSHQEALHALDIPPRSRLYGLVPCDAGGMWCESLTSYINRLAWVHGVSPRKLLVQEILPFISGKQWLRSSPSLVNVFSRRGGAMSLNGTEALATEVSTRFGELTTRLDLHLLTLRWWIGDLPVAKNLRMVPAWCSGCYHDWQEQGLPLYQPLLWMLQVVTICPRHQRRLLERCPYCQMYQSVIATDKPRLGECTQCSAWLGAGLDTVIKDDEFVSRQEWVIQSLNELHVLSVSSKILHWASFYAGLSLAMKETGAYSKLAQLTGINRVLLHRWTSGAYMPSLENILHFCYVCPTGCATR